MSERVRAHDGAESPGLSVRAALQTMDGVGMVVAERLVTPCEYPAAVQSLASKHGREASKKRAPRSIVLQPRTRVV